MVSLIFLAPIVVLLLSIASILHNLFLHSLSKVPGPKTYAISQLPYLYHLIKGDWHRVLRDFHQRYGPVVRYSPRDVSFISDDGFKRIYGHKLAGEKSYEKDPSFYQRLREAGNILNVSTLEHRRHRRLVAHAFSTKALSNQEGVLQHYAKLFVDNIGEYAKKESGIVDIVKWYNFATFDLVGDLAFGKSFGCLESAGYHPWVRLIFDNAKMFPLRQVFIRLNLETIALAFIPASVKKSVDEHHEYSTRTAMQRTESKDITREDFMSYILRYNDERGMSQEEIAENANLLIIGGSETTSSLLSGLTFYLLRHREVYDKLVTEIRETFDSEEDITLTRVGQLEYLLAVLHEGLRMYPPAPMGLPRLVPSGGDVIGGYRIPENTTVSVPHWITFRSESHFTEPNKFDPERWMNDPRYAGDNKDMFQPFSTGPRNCVGQNLAYAEMRLMLTRLLWRFDMELTPGNENWADQNVYIIWAKLPLNVRLTEVRREKGNKNSA